ncbi:MAG TPA: phosphoribosyltransferase family protein [Patescibacteria group bacterium]
MNTSEITFKILKKIGAIITNDHFVYTSGKHGSVYIRKDKLYPYTRLTSKVCKMIAQNTKDLKIDVVVGPSLGGIILSQWTAYHLSRLTKKEVLSVFTEKSYDDKEKFDRPQLLKRGYDQLVKGKRVLVVEDLTTTGMSVKKVVDRVKEAKGKVVGVYVLLNRNPKGVNRKLMNTTFKSLCVFEAEAWEEKDCPLCRKNVPVNTTVGHGKEFLAKKA